MVYSINSHQFPRIIQLVSSSKRRSLEHKLHVIYSMLFRTFKTLVCCPKHANFLRNHCSSFLCLPVTLVLYLSAYWSDYKNFISYQFLCLFPLLKFGSLQMTLTKLEIHPSPIMEVPLDRPVKEKSNCTICREEGDGYHFGAEACRYFLNLSVSANCSRVSERVQHFFVVVFHWARSTYVVAMAAAKLLQVRRF